jgi:HD-GYP domain-containing protein (c-di-GMP phosphodiesterase class II)
VSSTNPETAFQYREAPRVSVAPTVTCEENFDGHIRLSEVVSALSYALDLTEGQPIGHAVKSCVLAMRLAEELQLSPLEKSDLYYAVLLKDMGCSSNAARVHQIFGGDEQNIKRDLKTTDWQRLLEGFAYMRRHAAVGQSLFERFLRIVKIASGGTGQAKALVQIRCERGADIARSFGFSERCAGAIYTLDEHWNGRGHPHGLKGEEIPLLGRILGLCQTMEVFVAAFGADAAYGVLAERKGRWFDPRLVQAMHGLRGDKTLWRILSERDASVARALVIEMEPEGEEMMVDEARLTQICEGFASIIDAKSPWTFQHSIGVTEASVAIATQLELPAPEITQIRHAALLHDIGKLSVPNLILDKPGKLTEEEFAVVRKHPYFTERILEKINSFGQLAFIAGAHHERLDGSGYHTSLKSDELPISARIIAVADVFDAVSAKRPYRDAMPLERALSIIQKDTPHALCAECFDALKSWVEVRES